MTELEQIEAKLGIRFKQMDRLKEALTHTSYAAEHKLPYDQQRLEFLGDAVLEIVLSDALFHLEPLLPEGDMTKRRAVFAREDTLARLALNLNLSGALRMGKGERECKGYLRASTLADTFEAVIGALYLDQGLETAKTWVLKQFTAQYPTFDPGSDENPKGALQEYCAQHALGEIKYRLLPSKGPEHAQCFAVELSVNDCVYARGEGPRRKKAEAQAAQIALERLKAAAESAEG